MLSQERKALQDEIEKLQLFQKELSNRQKQLAAVILMHREKKEQTERYLVQKEADTLMQENVGLKKNIENTLPTVLSMLSNDSSDIPITTPVPVVTSAPVPAPIHVPVTLPALSLANIPMPPPPPPPLPPTVSAPPTPAQISEPRMSVIMSLFYVLCMCAVCL